MKRTIHGVEVEISPEADLREANLRGADLRGADLRWADLGGADLRWADLGGADLREANLRGADLRGADLRGADLRGGNLHGADLRGADLRGAVGLHILTSTAHGYTVMAVWWGDGWRIRAGCRDFTTTEALSHWHPDTYEHRPDAERIMLMLDWLDNQPVPQGGEGEG